MQYMKKNVFMAKSEAQVNTFNMMTTDLVKVAKVVKEMEGKVLNIRFNKKVSEVISGSLSQSNQYSTNEYRFEISYHSNPVSDFKYKSKDFRGEHIAYGSVEFYVSSFSVFVNPVNKRINSEETFKSIDKTIGYKNKHIDEWLRVRNNYDDIASRTKLLLDEISKFHRDIPSFARPYITIQDGYPVLELDE